MKELQIKILNAIQVIQDECNKYPDCKGCPFEIGGECKICVSPCDWDVVKDTSI